MLTVFLSTLRDMLYSACKKGHEPDSKFIRCYTKYVTEINFAYSKNGKAKAIAKHFIPNEDEYNRKVINWYKDELLTNLLKLLEFSTHEISFSTSSRSS